MARKKQRSGRAGPPWAEVRAVEFSAAEQSETGKTADLVGGKARARALTKARQEITGTAAVARWGKKV